MFPITLAEIAQLVGGRLTQPEHGGIVPTSGSIDSRSVQHGALFFALDGQHCRGADFVDAALAAGASCAMLAATDIGRVKPCGPAIVVPDVVGALVRLAEWNRRQSAAYVVGITGSVGKTTTRQMVAAVLAQGGACLQSPANYNNLLGVSLSLLQLTAAHQFAVLELGASAEGEIARLAALADPQTGVITRVAPAHLAEFGSLEGVQRGKGELARFLSDADTLVLNGDDERVVEMAAWTQARTVLAGIQGTCELRAENVRYSNGQLRFQVDGYDYETAVPSRECVFSALASMVIGQACGLTWDQIAAGLREFGPEAGRGRVFHHSGWTLIDETYNSSPASMSAAIETLSQWHTAGRRILVLGDMLELGPEAARYHRATGEVLSRGRVDQVYWLGQFAAAVREGWQTGLMRQASGVASEMPDVPLMDFGMKADRLVDELQRQLRPQDVVLCKGSRGVALERIVARLTNG